MPREGAFFMQAKWCFSAFATGALLPTTMPLECFSGQGFVKAVIKSDDPEKPELGLR